MNEQTNEVPIEDAEEGMWAINKEHDIEGIIQKSDSDNLYVEARNMFAGKWWVKIANGVAELDERTKIYRHYPSDSDFEYRVDNIIGTVHRGDRLKLRDLTNPVEAVGVESLIFAKCLKVRVDLTEEEARMRRYMSMDHDDPNVMTLGDDNCIQYVIRPVQLPEVAEGRPSLFFTQQPGTVVIHDGDQEDDRPWGVYEGYGSSEYYNGEILKKNHANLFPLIPAANPKEAH